MKFNRLAYSAVLLAALAGCSKSADDPSDGPVSAADDKPLFPAPTFKLTDQDNQPFSSDRLKGKTWIATLFFTSCPGPCPMMCGRLRDIQKAIPDPDVMLVSFSVDPKHDTPDLLKAYADRMGADDHRWKFLCGTPEDTQKIADGLHLGYESPADNNGQIVHSTRFLLVDKTGQVRGVYSTDDDASMEKLKADAKKLAAME